MNRSTPVAFAIVGVAVALLLWLEPMHREEIALTVSSTTITAGSYDTLESPRGSAYLVPSDKDLYITAWTGNPHVDASTDFTLEIGYGDTSVSNSATAPTGATVVYALSWRAADGPPEPQDAWIPIPGGTYPFVRPVGAAGAFSATGQVD